jgi:hypothetical protein
MDRTCRIELVRVEMVPTRNATSYHIACLHSIPVVSVAALMVVYENTSFRSYAKVSCMSSSIPEVVDVTTTYRDFLFLPTKYQDY